MSDQLSEPDVATCRMLLEQQSHQLQQLSGQLTERGWELGRLQHCAAEAEAARELCRALAADLEAAREEVDYLHQERSQAPEIQLQINGTRSEWVISTSSQTESFGEPATETSHHSVSQSESVIEGSEQAASQSCEKLSDKISELDFVLAEKNEQLDAMQAVIVQQEQDLQKLADSLMEAEAGHAADHALMLVQQDDLRDQVEISQNELKELREQAQLTDTLLQQSQEQCTALHSTVQQLDDARQDDATRMANARSELSGTRKHAAQVEREAAQLAVELGQARHDAKCLRQKMDAQRMATEQEFQCLRHELQLRTDKAASNSEQLRTSLACSRAEVEELRAAMQRMGAELQRRGLQVEVLQGERAGCLGELERELGRRRLEAGHLQSLRDELQQQVGLMAQQVSLLQASPQPQVHSATSSLGLDRPTGRTPALDKAEAGTSTLQTQDLWQLPGDRSPASSATTVTPEEAALMESVAQSQQWRMDAEEELLLPMGPEGQSDQPAGS
ncbi:hypothetical protein WJX73_007115 [Symbiochloris irregularis]|uniref:Uncharacterized protein n=1 Tax=Symbiochloris irregularis TaxID=706552 RepID=A0AAW1PQS5_9CHLO